MRQVNTEQFEDILAGQIEPPAELDEADRAALDEARAIRGRLQQAAGSLRPPADLAERVRATLATGDVDRPGKTLWFPRRWGAVAAAACVVAAMGVYLLITSPQQAVAQDDLYRIHHSALDQADPVEQADTLPHLPPDCRYIGSIQSVFRNKPLQCLVVDMGGETVTILQLTDPPDSLGFSTRLQEGGRTWFACHYRECGMVATARDGRSYVAVGAADRASLMAVLDAFLQ
jgi:hypothetical protein